MLVGPEVCGLARRSRAYATSPNRLLGPRLDGGRTRGRCPARRGAAHPTPLATAALIAQSVVIIGLVHLPKGFWNYNGGIEFALSLAAGVVALAGTGPGSASLDAALRASYSEAARALLIAVGVLGALVALAIPRVALVKSPPPAPPR